MDGKQSTKQLTPAQRALLALKKASRKIERLERESIAIIGMGCRFPGGANSIDKFWKFLKEEKDAVKEVSPDRWDMERYYDPDPEAAFKVYTKQAALLEEPLDEFDPAFFRISPIEAKTLDPQHRILLEVSWEALENGAVDPLSLPKETGIYVGMMGNDHTHLMRSLGYPDVYAVTGNDTYFAVGRLAFQLGITGPNIAIGAACASSLVTIHLACQSLRLGEIDLALAGGVQIITTPETSIGVSNLRALAPDGRCKTFDQSADGYGRGEGCGIVVLKRLSDALADRDHIWAIVKGSATNHNGSNAGLTAPDRNAQISVIQKALKLANVTGDKIGYVEAHGTGTPLGDPIEINSIVAALGERVNPLYVGSVKTNIGHLEPAAGVAGLIKTALALHQQEIPAHLHFKNPSTYIDWDNLPVKIPSSPQPWPRGNEERLAGVSSFGMGGANAHVILQEAPLRKEPHFIERSNHLMVFSAKTRPGLFDLLHRYENYLSQPKVSQENFGDICFTTTMGRAHFPERLSITSFGIESALSKLRLAKSSLKLELESDFESPRVEGKIAFLFTGQGSQYIDMGRILYETEPLFKKILHQCDEILRPWIKGGLLSILYPSLISESEGLCDYTLDDTIYTQPALFAIEYALAKLWISWGVNPDVLIGHSVGEYAAACIAGVFSLEDGLKLIAERARLMQAQPKDGDMLSVLASEARVTEILQPFLADVEVAVVNGPNSVVVSGRRTVIDQVVEILEKKKIKIKRLTVSHAFHSVLMEPLLDEFEKVAQEIQFASPKIDLVSNLTGQLASEEISTPEYWRRHVREGVQFFQGMQTLEEMGVNLFLEMGPAPTLLGMGRQCVREDSAFLWLPSLRKQNDDWQQILESLGQVYQWGMTIDWGAFEKASPHHKTPLPTYPFQRQSYWYEYDETITRRLHREDIQKIHPLIDRQIESGAMSRQGELLYETELTAGSTKYLADHLVFDHVIFPATGYLEMVLSVGKDLLKNQILQISEFNIQRALLLPPQGAVPIKVQLSLTPLDSGYSWEIFSRQGQNDWLEHGRGIIHSSQPETVDGASLVDLKSQISDRIDLKEHYRWFKKRGVEYGAHFQSIRQIFSSELQVLGEIEIPVSLQKEVSKNVIHPVILDACLRLAAVTITEESGTDIFLPTSIKRVTLFTQEPLSAIWVHGIQSDVEGASSPTHRTFDMTLYSPTGEIVARLNDFIARRANPRSLLGNLSKGQDGLADFFFQPNWKESEVLEKREVSASDQVLLLIYPLESSNDLKELLKTLVQYLNHMTVQEIKLGSQYRKVSPDRWEIPSADPKAIGEVILEMKKPDQVFFFSGIYSQNMEESGQLAKSLEEGNLSLFRLFKAFNLKGWLDDFELTVLTVDAWQAGMSDFINPYVGALTGFARSAAKEYPGCLIRCLDISQEDLQSLESRKRLNQLIQDEPATGGTEFIALRQGKRLKNSPIPISLPAPKQSTFKKKGVYLIAGGTGGLGLTLCEYLTEKYDAKVILTGRRELDETAEQKHTLMTRDSGEIFYVQADLTDLESMQAAVSESKEQYGKIDGVFHSALVLRDGTIANLSEDDLKIALASKVFGSQTLYQSVANEELDFLIFFSSAQSFVGSPGQSAYASGNTFEDAYSSHLNRIAPFPVKVINWGFWGEAGVVSDEEYSQRFAAQGILPIRLEEGMEALERIVSSQLSQVIAIKAEPKGLATLGVDTKVKNVHFSNEVITNVVLEEITSAVPNTQVELIEKYLKDQVRKFVGETIPTTDLKNKSFIELGVDSLLSIELTNQIKKDLQVKLPIEKLLSGITINELVTELALEITGDESSKNESEVDESQLYEMIGPVPVPRDRDFPLSFNQESAWQHHLSHPKDPTFNIPTKVIFKGDLNRKVMIKAYNEIWDRHEVLRCTFKIVDNVAIQRPKTFDKYIFEELDISHLSGFEQEKALQGVQEENFKTPFDIERGPVWRMKLVKQAEDLHILYICIHHLAIDAQSYMIFLDDFVALYKAFLQGKPSPLPTLAIQYADYAYWQRQIFTPEKLQERLAYWKDMLAETPEPLKLSDTVRRATQPGESKHMEMTLSAALTEQLKEIGGQKEVTLYMTLVTALSLLLKRLSGSDDIIIGSPTSQRKHEDVQSIIGYLSGMSILRIDMTGLKSVGGLMARVKKVVTGAIKNQDLTFMQLRHLFRKDGTIPVARPHQVVLNALPVTSDLISLPGLTIQAVPIQRTVMVGDLAISIEKRETKDGEPYFGGIWRYRSSLFSEEAVRTMMDDFLNILELIVDTPDIDLASVLTNEGKGKK
ncbi:MAG: hypothetical protein COB67_01015 [SAR324 cluster bacterium]|uniref:Uncharacterized protein n=1 Tax=SAR324 cluster bacterium TaxID=2024889 RepID=A0A2A4TB42_9DELT|nr:MAG: hypothetical protein COB67_01015 [SAR324 cluster bacterium]